MTRELQALDKVKGSLVEIEEEDGIILHAWQNCEEETDIIENALKEKEQQDEILHIIKEKEPSLMRIRLTDSAEHYNLIMLENKKLTQAEFVILKEFVSSKRGHSHD